MKKQGGSVYAQSRAGAKTSAFLEIQLCVVMVAVWMTGMVTEREKSSDFVGFVWTAGIFGTAGAGPCCCNCADGTQLPQYAGHPDCTDLRVILLYQQSPLDQYAWANFGMFFGHTFLWMARPVVTAWRNSLYPRTTIK